MLMNTLDILECTTEEEYEAHMQKVINCIEIGAATLLIRVLKKMEVFVHGV